MHATSKPEMAARLLFEGIGKRFGRSVALEGLSLAVEPGEIFGFLGPNGAGKSTAIHLAMGFLRASSGRGELLGRPFTRARAARARVGYVPDAPVFFGGSALDAVLLTARLNDTEQRRSTAGLEARALELLRWLDLPAGNSGKDAAKDVRKFSRGQQQRLALVQALVTRPELLVLDEPTSALDPPAVMLVREALERARGEGVAVFFSSHQLQEVEQLCDRAAFLDQGRLLHTGAMAELLEEGATARMTLRGLREQDTFVQTVKGALRAASAGTARGDLVFAVPVAGQRAFLERAWLAGAELVRVERERRTLEDLFAGRRAARPTAQETSRRGEQR